MPALLDDAGVLATRAQAAVLTPTFLLLLLGGFAALAATGLGGTLLVLWMAGLFPDATWIEAPQARTFVALDAPEIVAEAISTVTAKASA